MNTPLAWHTEFAKVIACTKCTADTCRDLLRDCNDNVPQPGYVGPAYSGTRVLLVGQNPGTRKLARESLDRTYAAALRALRDEPTPQRYAELSAILRGFIPHWPVTNNYFPLDECGLTLDDIAYCNIIRCRTIGDRKPNQELARRCVSEHFVNWLRWLAPRVVIFIGKWAWEHGHVAVADAGIPFSYMNRQRSLSSIDRSMNRAEVIALVRQFRG